MMLHVPTGPSNLLKLPNPTSHRRDPSSSRIRLKPSVSERQYLVSARPDLRRVLLRHLGIPGPQVNTVLNAV